MNEEQTMNFYRDLLKSVDQSLMETISLRLKIAAQLGQFKKEHHLPIIQQEAANDVYKRWCDFSVQMNLPQSMGHNLAKSLMDASEYVQKL